MRIDKYLWCVRLFKTRSQAAKKISNGGVQLNNEVIKKSAKEIAVGDVIKVRNNPIWKSFEILDIPKSRVGAKLVPDLILETTSDEDLELLRSVQKQNQQRHQMGLMGRPTKKDRRNLNDFLGN